MSGARFEPDAPQEYSHDDDIPFAPEGNGPLISGYMEMVVGNRPFKGMHCVRKTVIQESASNKNLAKRLLIRETRAL